ncbi:MAG: hypothetical protein K2Q22_07180, partial [Cytophagales bacterium]|nr:hypothetical protein [Cytophagales bacterium]
MAWLGMAFLSAGPVLGQALDQIGKEKNPFKITGGLSASQIVYAQSGLDANRRSPYNYFLSGNLNLSIWGFSIPVSFTYSNQRTQFQQPFNQFSLSPTYKWAKFYAGYSTMTFSPYTLNGHIFLGGGVQLTPPGLFRCSAMFGRLNQAVEEDTSNTSVIPYYLRWGGGFKVGVGKGGDGVDATFFMAKDDANSLARPILKNQVKPMENAVLGISFSKVLFKRLNLSGEYAASALTNNSTDPVTSLGSKGAFAIVPAVSFKTSTAIYDAYKASLNYAAEKFTLGVGYERINPGYRTLGAYYFNDDLENITGNGSIRLMGNKLALSASVGTQRNNLKNEKMSQMNRFVGSFSLNFSPSPKISFSASYSNFQSYTSVRKLTPIEQQQFKKDPMLNGNPDTLRFVQLTQSANASVNYVL